jgi:hypothetical protein
MNRLKHKIRASTKGQAFTLVYGIRLKNQIWFRVTTEAHKVGDLVWEALDLVRESLREDSK